MFRSEDLYQNSRGFGRKYSTVDSGRSIVVVPTGRKRELNSNMTELIFLVDKELSRVLREQ